MIRNKSFKRIITGVLTSVLIALSVIGCGSSSSGGGGGSADGSGVKVFFSTLTLDDFKTLVMNSVIEAGKSSGVTVDVGEPCATVDDQVAQIRDAASKGYDAIICNPVDTETALQLEVTAGDQLFIAIGTNKYNISFFQIISTFYDFGINLLK